MKEEGGGNSIGRWSGKDKSVGVAVSDLLSAAGVIFPPYE